MLQRSTIIIDSKKSDEFKKFMQKNAKTKAFWQKNKESAARPVDKAALDALFNTK